MPSKPETSFYRRVNKRVDPTVHREKMNNPFRGGTPDFYYEGITGIVWVEYKFWTSVPRVITPDSIVSPLQWEWIQRAHSNEVNIATIVGYQKGGAIIRPNDKPVSNSQFKNNLSSIEDLADWIERITLYDHKLDFDHPCPHGISNNTKRN